MRRADRLFQIVQHLRGGRLVTARQLADWIVEDRLPVRFQMQLHKILWNDEPGR